MLTTNAKIKAYRQQANMTQEETAAKLGMSRQSYCYKEHGTTQWKLNELEDLAALFGVNVKDLLGD